MNPEQQAKILNALQQRGVSRKCPRCGNEEFALLNGYFVQNTQDSPEGPRLLGGAAVPTVVVICTRCGFIAQHALGVLGLLGPAPRRLQDALARPSSNPFRNLPGDPYGLPKPGGGKNE